MTDTVRDSTHRHRFRLGPSWRWLIAEHLAQNDTSCVAESTDELTQGASRYIRQTRGDREMEPTSEVDSNLLAAINLWETVSIRKDITLLVLGDVPADRIVRRTGTSPEVVEIVEQLFCDIRDCREATSWIHAHVIQPIEKVEDGAWWATQFRAALEGGPPVAEALLDGKLPQEQLRYLANLELLLNCRLHMALQIPLKDERSCLKVAALYLNYEHRKDKLKLAKAKFHQRCEEDRLRRELSQMRMEAAAEQRELRNRERRRREEVREQQREETRQLKQHRYQLLRERIQSAEAERTQREKTSPLARLMWNRDDQAVEIGQHAEKEAA